MASSVGALQLAIGGVQVCLELHDEDRYAGGKVQFCQG